MSWIAILLGLLGPLIQKLIEKWLTKAAKDKPAPQTAEELDAIFADAIGLAKTPKVRRALRAARRVAAARHGQILAAAAGATAATLPPLTDEEKVELKDAAA